MERTRASTAAGVRRLVLFRQPVIFWLMMLLVIAVAWVAPTQDGAEAVGNGGPVALELLVQFVGQ